MIVLRKFNIDTDEILDIAAVMDNVPLSDLCYVYVVPRSDALLKKYPNFFDMFESESPNGYIGKFLSRNVYLSAAFGVPLENNQIAALKLEGVGTRGQ